jgi:hypothetical protein
MGRDRESAPPDPKRITGSNAKRWHWFARALCWMLVAEESD